MSDVCERCDRCGGEGPFERVRAKCLCDWCLSQLDIWLQPTSRSVRTGQGLRIINRVEQVRFILDRRGYITGHLLAELNGEPYRISYHSLRNMARQGQLTNHADGVFTYPGDTRPDNAPVGARERITRAFNDALVLREFGDATLEDAARLAAAYHKAGLSTLLTKLERHYENDRRVVVRGARRKEAAA